MRVYKIIILLLCLCSCTTLKDVEVYFAGKNELQYFIRPSTLDSNEGIINCDFSFRMKEKSIQKAIINFTIRLNNGKIIKHIQKAAFLFDNGRQLDCEDTTLLFFETTERKSRFTANLQTDAMITLLHCNNTVLKIETENKVYQFLGTGHFYSQMHKGAAEIE